MGRLIRHSLPEPEYDVENGWLRSLPPYGPATQVKRELRFDWTIIGAGACGLSTARELARLRPQDRIALVDASRAGYGASGRNAGFMLDHNTHGKTVSEAIAKRNNALCTRGVGILRNLVSEFAIDCDWSDWGRIYVSAGQTGSKHLRNLEADFTRDGIEFTHYAKAAMQELTATGFYHEGLRVKGNGLVNPAALMRGLAQNLPENVQLFENSKVERVANDGSWILGFGGGEIRSSNIIYCTNVFSFSFGVMTNRLAPIATFASITEKLDAISLARFGEREFALLPATENGSTVRLLRDGRLLVRNCFDYRDRAGFSRGYLDEVAAKHRYAMKQRWPALANLRFTDTWSGLLGFSRNDGIAFGQIASNAYINISSDAAPVARGTAVGALLAEKICGIGSSLLKRVEDSAKPAILPPDWMLKHVVRHRIRSFEKEGAEEF